MDRMADPAYAARQNEEEVEGVEECLRYLFEGFPPMVVEHDEPVRDEKPAKLRGHKTRIVIPVVKPRPDDDEVTGQLLPELQGAATLPLVPVQGEDELNELIDELPLELQGAAALPLDSTVTQDLIDWDIEVFEGDEDEEWTRPLPSCSTGAIPTLLEEDNDEADHDVPPLHPLPPLRTQNSAIQLGDHRRDCNTWSGAPRREANAPKTKYRKEGYCPQCGEVGGHFKRDDCKASKLEKKEYAKTLDGDTEFPFRKEHRDSRYNKYLHLRRMEEARGTPKEKQEWKLYRTVCANHARLIKQRELLAVTLGLRARGENIEADYVEAIVTHLLNRLFDNRFHLKNYQQIFNEIVRVMGNYQQ